MTNPTQAAAERLQRAHDAARPACYAQVSPADLALLLAAYFESKGNP